MFLADLIPGAQDDAGAADDDDASADEPAGPAGGMFIPGFTEDEESDGVLSPITGDEAPFAGEDVPPDEVLKPVEEDEEPVIGGETDPDELLDPVDEPGEDAPAPQDATLLQRLLGSQTDFSAGAGWLGKYGPDTDETELAGNEDHTEEDEDTNPILPVILASRDGTPAIGSAGPVNVISGGEGDTRITLGSTPAYAFGGDGSDTITGGAGAAAIFGGAGDDRLAGTATATWIDGGEGDDVIAGGEGDDTLWGGAHGAGDDAVQDDDAISGGDGDDHIAGGYGADTLSGGAGDDVIDHLGRVEQTYSVPHHEFAWHIDNDADTLDGGAGNDTLIMDRADSAIGGTGHDTFWVYFDDATGSGAADVGDFSVGEDFLRITLNPDLDHGDMALRVEPSADGQDAIVRVNDAIVAILRGAPNATGADVLVEVTGNIFG
ncbi:calcium-binding protein [Sinisalibacter aestuarii]|nr:calcium-binding protein [Sinisalibacter aestuarii]